METPQKLISTKRTDTTQRKVDMVTYWSFPRLKKPRMIFKKEKEKISPALNRLCGNRTAFK